MLETINQWASVIGLALTGIGLIAVAYQLFLDRKVARNDFMLRFYEYVQQYNDIHLLLTETDWYNSTKGPETQEEWGRVRRYMGLLEGLWRVMEDGVYPKERADRDFSHRVLAIVRNPVIYEQCFVKDRFAWDDFINLWHCLETYPVYRGLADGYQKEKGVSVPKSSAL
jgi:hypothetical protein